MDKMRPLVFCLFFISTSKFLLNSAEVRKYIAGALYHPNDKVLYNSFKAGVRRMNADNMLPYGQRLETTSFKTDGENMLGCEAAKRLGDASCIFDLSFGDERSYALAEQLRIPMVVLKPVFGDRWRSDYVFTLQSPEEPTAAAVIDLLHYYIKTKNEKVAILAERKRAHLGARIFSLMLQRHRVVPYMMPELVMENYRETQRALTVLLRSRMSYVVLVCDPSDTRALLEKAMRLGCVTKESKWITPEMEINGNISALALRGLLGLRLHATATKRLKREAEKNELMPRDISGLTYALLNDSLYAVGMAMKKLMLGRIILDETKSSKDCQIRGSISTGKQQTILDFLSRVKMRGLTGPVSFKPVSNERAVETFDIINIQLQSRTLLSQKYKLGHLTVRSNSNLITMRQHNQEYWNGEYWQGMQCEFKKQMPFAATDQNSDKVIVVTTRVDEPFMMEKKNQTGKKGNDRFEGFSKDLLDLLSRKGKFKYEIRISEERSYGSVVNGEWRGIIGELVRQEADIAIGPITITAEREGVIDFSKPFLDFRIAMILQKPKEEEVNLFAFLLPFDEQLWGCTCAVVGLVTLIMWIVDRFSPYGYRAEAEATGEGDGKEFTLSNSLWFATGSILQQGGDNTPRSGSGRVLAAAFWLFTLILISTYTANLAAYFTAKNTKSSINSLEDLVSQDVVRYGVQEGGSLYTFFRDSKVRIYKKMYGKMNTLKTFVNGTSYGVQKARTEPFAYLTDQPSLDYYNQRQPCNTMLVKNLLDAKSYALGLQRNSEWTNTISVAILQLREEGELEKLRFDWWDNRSECGPEETIDTSSPQRLELHNLAGVFIILGGGACISLVLLLMENRCKDVFGSGRPQSAEESARNDANSLSCSVPAITINDGSKLKLINNAERRMAPDSKHRQSPLPASPPSRGHTYDMRSPQRYTPAP